TSRTQSKQLGHLPDSCVRSSPYCWNVLFLEQGGGGDHRRAVRAALYRSSSSSGLELGQYQDEFHTIRQSRRSTLFQKCGGEASGYPNLGNRACWILSDSRHQQSIPA